MTTAAPRRPDGARATMPPPMSPLDRHALWVRLAHAILAASLFTLAFSGVVILMAHPRL